MAKARSDSQLKSLAEKSEDFGDKLFAWCNEPKTNTCPGGYQYARDQLAQDGVVLGNAWLRKLSEFYSWWELRQEFASADQEAKEIQELLETLNLGLTAEKIETAGQLVFTRRALAKRDPEEYREMEYLRLHKETAKSKAQFEAQKIEIRQAAEERGKAKLALEREKWITISCEKILAAARDERARAIADNVGLSNAEKIAKLRETYFADIDALEKSGAVELPQ